MKSSMFLHKYTDIMSVSVCHCERTASHTLATEGRQVEGDLPCGLGVEVVGEHSISSFP